MKWWGEGNSLLVIGMDGHGLALVNLPMPSQIGNDRKVSPAAFDIAGEWLLASVAIHVRLQRTWSGKALVTDLALVLLLRIG
jgi:hypothetical protein